MGLSSAIANFINIATHRDQKELSYPMMARRYDAIIASDGYRLHATKSFFDLDAIVKIKDYEGNGHHSIVLVDGDINTYPALLNMYARIGPETAAMHINADFLIDALISMRNSGEPICLAIHRNDKASTLEVRGRIDHRPVYALIMGLDVDDNARPTWNPFTTTDGGEQ